MRENREAGYLHAGRVRGSVLERLAGVVNLRPHDLVVDVGSGDGFVVSGLAAMFGCRCFGAELVRSRHNSAALVTAALGRALPTLDGFLSRCVMAHEPSRAPLALDEWAQAIAVTALPDGFLEAGAREALAGKTRAAAANLAGTSAAPAARAAASSGCPVRKPDSAGTTDPRAKAGASSRGAGAEAAALSGPNTGEVTLSAASLARRAAAVLAERYSLDRFGDVTSGAQPLSAQAALSPFRWPLGVPDPEAGVFERHWETHPAGIPTRVELRHGNALTEDVLPKQVLAAARVVFINNFQNKWQVGAGAATLSAGRHIETMEDRVLKRLTRCMSEGSILVTCSPLRLTSTSRTGAMVQKIEGRESMSHAVLYFHVHGGVPESGWGSLDRWLEPAASEPHVAAFSEPASAPARDGPEDASHAKLQRRGGDCGSVPGAADSAGGDSSLCDMPCPQGENAIVSSVWRASKLAEDAIDPGGGVAHKVQWALSQMLALPVSDQQFVQPWLR
ncbi:hypothetical protein FNF31_06460 [Cafeteria roenbergensis]|uniref:DOT1 domain-containing protein n=1 Tax=Cafeteria roenbergensis TaxID=33653 RepID=A0A5A8CKE4_CAFRO|nr:hypothetical protein FNF31_06460 [Cafeteria roenbergensis]